MPAHAGIQGDRVKAAETLDPRIRGDDSQRRRPKSSDEAAAARVLQRPRSTVSCPRMRASRATGQKQLKPWIPAFAGMTVSAGVQRALMKRPPRAFYNVRITEFGPPG